VLVAEGEEGRGADGKPGLLGEALHGRHRQLAQLLPVCVCVWIPLSLVVVVWDSDEFDTRVCLVVLYNRSHRAVLPSGRLLEEVHVAHQVEGLRLWQ
jgi:hypothetical protein